MDLDPFVPVGIQADTMRVIDIFLLHCLLSDSAPDSPEENVRLASNQHRTAARGREPGLTLDGLDGPVPLLDWGRQLLDECQGIAVRMAEVLGDERYVSALADARRALAEPEGLPSAHALQAMRDAGDSYVAFIRAQARATRQQLLALPYSDELRARFEAEVQTSLAAQERIEANDSLPFEQYRQQYLQPERLGR